MHDITPRALSVVKSANSLPNLFDLFKLLGVAAIYALTSWLLEMSFVPNGEETIFFLPSGLALVAVLMGGRRYTWAVALGAFSGNMLFGSPFIASALMASGSALATLVGAFLINRQGRFDARLSTLSDVLRLWLFGSLVAATVSAVLGTTALWLTGLVSNEAFATNLIQWWMGDTMGVVLITPVILAWWPSPPCMFKRPSLKLCLEYALIMSMVVLIAGSVHLDWLKPLAFTKFQYFASAIAHDYWIFLTIVWASLRLGLRGASLALLLVALIGQIGIYKNVGLFGASTDDQAQLVNYWVHTIILSVIGVALGTLVTANRKVTNLLQQSKSTLSHELHHITMALDHHSIVTVSDAHERITWANDKLCEISGYSTEELLGQNHRLFKSGMQSEEFYKDLYQTIYAGRIWQGELCNRAKDGHLFWLQTTVTPFIGDDGKPEKYINISTDISENKRLEAFAQAGNIAKSDFLANMSHEIRTPMNGVIGMVDILQQSKLTPAQKRMLDTVQKSSMALLSIVNDILDFSKIESGKLQVENIAFNLRELAESVAQLMVATAVTKSIDLCLYVSPELPAWVLSDPSRLRQVLLNLLGNAVKFTRGNNNQAARVVLVVEPCILKQGGPGFKFCVSDSGIGMNPETLGKLFQPFTQADESTSRKFGGSGLGLSISKRLVELMRGQIYVSSTLGEGSEFTVEIPLLRAPARSMPVFGARLDGVHILTAIEDTGLAAAVSSYCRDAGATVTAMPHLDAARHHLNEHPEYAADTVVLVGSELDLGPLDLPEAAQVVRLVKQINIHHTNTATLRACPLIYNELIRAVAIACGRLALSVVPQWVQQHNLVPHVPLSASTSAASKDLILLAEDNETNRDVIQAQLQLLGYASETAADGAIALAMWKTNRFALLLTDCHMPNMDGFELTAAIRRAETRGIRFPIIAVTANALQGEAQRCLQRGMDGYISKPLRMVDLAPLLEKWLPLPPLQAQLNAPEQAAPADLLATWDDATLTTMVGNNPALHLKLLTKFITNAQQQVNAMVTAIEAGECNQAADIAHALKSSSRMVGALMLGELCESMETAGELQDLTACVALVPYIKTTFSSAQTSIAQHISLLELA